jgi:aromatic-L-amino-acid/L-tryptophan decarboxylase
MTPLVLSDWSMPDMETMNSRYKPIEMSPEEFRAAGYELVDRISEFLSWIQDRSNPVTRSESPKQIRELLGSASLPQTGAPPPQLLREASSLLFDHSLFNGHPRFWGYITSTAAPIGMLADLLAAAVNPNCGAFALSPVATEIERQALRWIAEMVSYPANCGGILVSGGNMANFVCFLAARKARGQQIKTPRIYCSAETHTWIQKAVDMFGLGGDSIAWISVDSELRMKIDTLKKQIQDDLQQGITPLMVIGAAGTVGTGAVDPLPEIAAICREHDIWFHVDGAYGALAAMLPDASPDLKALSLADSVAVDPHKWLYVPLEAGCVLIRDSQILRETFSYHPAYYRFDDHAEEELTNFYELGPQNSRGFRALKVWLAIRQLGKEGYVRMLSDDCNLAMELFQAVQKKEELEALTCNLSITTFRYVPRDLNSGKAGVEEYLNRLNFELLRRLQNSGLAYPSNAVIHGKYALRVCIVNFRTTLADVRELPEIVLRLGHDADAEIRKTALKQSS